MRVAAAEEAQAALDAAVRVRMGIHTGEPTLTTEGYVGIDVHRGARITSAAHGGQVLVSAARTPPARTVVDLRDLGEHRLKDFDEPDAALPARARGVPAAADARTTEPSRAAEPARRRRAGARAEVALLRSEGRGSSTLTGPGGTGKTRFAIEAAAELVADFSRRRLLVRPRRDPRARPRPAGGCETSRRVGDLAEHVGDKRMLLVLDNFEQVDRRGAAVADLLARCRDLTLLVTSREPLRVAGEHEYRSFRSEAGDRAVPRAGASLDPTFEASREICRRLGPPAARDSSSPLRGRGRSAPTTCSQRLDQRLASCDRRRARRAERQLTLRATIEWSVRPARPDERATFRRLAVFAGRLPLEAAEAVTGADVDTLESLVEKSLVRHGRADASGCSRRSASLR